MWQAFFGVFDGHGGSKAAEFAAHNLEKNVMDEVSRRDDDDDIEEAVKHGYLNTDSGFLKEDLHGGSCCVTALIRDGNLVVSNAGDCRAVISRDGIAEALTSDHRPSREDEKHRIETNVSTLDLQDIIVILSLFWDVSAKFFIQKLINFCLNLFFAGWLC